MAFKTKLIETSALIPLQPGREISLRSHEHPSEISAEDVRSEMKIGERERENSQLNTALKLLAGLVPPLIPSPTPTPSLHRYENSFK